MRYLVLLCLSWCALPVHAVTKVDLYNANVVLSDTENGAEAAARVTGLKEVIVRASGSKEALDNEVIRKAMQNSARYMTQMSFSQNEQGRVMNLGFDASQVRGLLTQAQVPFWPEARANILVWIVDEQGYDRNIVWEHTNSELAKSLQLAAKKRGLPVTIPVGDFDDITGIAVSDLWGNFTKPISEASRRYPVDAVLVIKAQEQRLRWVLYDMAPSAILTEQKAPLTGSFSDGDNEVMTASLVDQLSQYYAEKSAVTIASQSTESMQVKFSQVGGALDFFTLENRLKSLNSVASLDILSVQGHDVTFQVHLLVTPTEFEQQLLSLDYLAKVDAFTGQVKQQEQTIDESSAQFNLNAFDGEVVENPFIEPLIYNTNSVQHSSETSVTTFEWLGVQ
ncbi:hypothetical protein BCU68_05145 [Vibrio sp. 10N.286.49.B3]|uniref:DUF2066 domain-containing protein n=1 Tax=Vibrio sp. 10N.286.49.B3 TaxID=1880855 RepID=UPI000C866194|nr:DUF2066 domain-containing protein [Vibrio sp. 10N.286.49.B3]PMH41068.1 hypothetical protein BCU68_05145 [Vibrio sp. 10N.286.49.B3]